MRKARVFEKGSAGEMAQLLLNANQFDVTEYVSCLKFPGENFNSRLTAVVNVSFSRSTDGAEECSVTFDGIGVSSSRSMNYSVETMPKLEARIKRLIRKANDIVSRRARREASDAAIYVNTSKSVSDAGIETYRQSDFGGDVTALVNGYTINISEELDVDINISHNRIKVSIADAIIILNSLPTNPKYDAEDWK